MRIVSLTCSNTEIVCALGCADFLVGVDSASDHPPEVVERLPRVGPDLGIDVGRVAALEPDLVLASLTVPGHEKVVEALAAAGLPYIAPAPTRVRDVYDDIRTIASHLGVARRGEVLAAELEEAIREASAPPGAAGGAGRRPRLLLEWWPKPVIAPGRRSWAHDLIEAAGAENVLGGEDVASRPLGDEEVRDLHPDGVVISWCGVEPAKYRPDVVLRNPAWKELAFVRHRRVYNLPEAWIGRPGPRLVRGLEALGAIVRELAPAVDGAGELSR